MVLLYGISTSVGYLKPNPVNKYISCKLTDHSQVRPKSFFFNCYYTEV